MLYTVQYRMSLCAVGCTLPTVYLSVSGDSSCRSFFPRWCRILWQGFGNLIRLHTLHCTLQVHPLGVYSTYYTFSYTLGMHCSFYTLGVHCSLYTLGVHCSFYTLGVHCSLYTLGVHCSFYTLVVPCSLYNLRVHCTLNTLVCALFIGCFMCFTVQCTIG